MRIEKYRAEIMTRGIVYRFIRLTASGTDDLKCWAVRMVHIWSGEPWYPARPAINARAA